MLLIISWRVILAKPFLIFPGGPYSRKLSIASFFHLVYLKESFFQTFFFLLLNSVYYSNKFDNKKKEDFSQRWWEFETAAELTNN